MPARTHDLFATLGREKNLRVLLRVLRSDHGLRSGALADDPDVGLSQPAVSQALRQLRDQGLITNTGQRSPNVATLPRATRALIRAAALIEHERTRSPDAHALAVEMLRTEMSRGADDARTPSVDEFA